MLRWVTIVVFSFISDSNRVVMHAAKKQQNTINVAFVQQLCYTASCGGGL